MSQLNQSIKFLQDQNINRVDVAIILGTGLGKYFVDSMEIIREIPYDKIPNFPEATVEFHHGKLVYGKISDRYVLAFNGRFHFYEGYSMKEVVIPVRISKGLGAKYLLISNAAGCIHLDWKKGDLMLIEDHINLQPTNPLIGQNNEELGPRFPDMSNPYDPNLMKGLSAVASEMDVILRKGVYAGVPGPMLETKAEYRYLQIIGADAVGMSTVPEVIAANHGGLPCLAVSVLTDMCDPDNLHPIDVPDIIATAGKVEPVLTDLFIELIKRHS